MATGVIESISKTSLVVTTTDKATITLIGKPAEDFAPKAKLGDTIDFTVGQDGTTATKVAKSKQKETPATTTGGKSPTVKMAPGIAARETATW